MTKENQKKLITRVGAVLLVFAIYFCNSGKNICKSDGILLI